MQNYHHEKCFGGQVNGAIRAQKGIWPSLWKERSKISFFFSKIGIEGTEGEGSVDEGDQLETIGVFISGQKLGLGKWR